MNNRSGNINKIAVRNTLVFNLALWICSFVLFLFLFTEDGQPKTIDFVYTGSFLTTIVFPVLINFYVLIPLLLKHERYWFYAFAFIFNIVLFGQFNILFFEYLIDYIFPNYYFISYHSNIALFTIFSVFLVITTLIKLSVDWFYFNSQENQELKFRNQLIQTQLAALRSQINPHFLFNSLNVIYALAIEQKEQTKDAIVQLSDILRYVIYDSNTKLVSLKKEVTLLKNYIEFQQFRHQQNDNITFHCNIEDDNYKIYPMLLLPLVENSFKYGIKGDIKNTFIRMNLEQEKDEFLFNIENNYSENKLETNGQSGLGLENIRKNLEIVYPKTHKFNVAKTKDSFKVTLKLYSHEV
ncbi:histidine kinase [Flavobacteriaceae bacterium MAR_2010_105]|nr:histidine kinase [Flavobacteriaceae bacterium MAR_2010_105]